MKTPNLLILLFCTILNLSTKAETTWKHTFQEGDVSKNTTGFTISDKTWNLTWGTTEKNIKWDKYYLCLKYGSANYPAYPIFSSTDFNGIISSVSIEARTNSSAKDNPQMSVTVDGKPYGQPQALTKNFKTYTFTGEESGEIKISFEIVGYIRSISITYSDGSSLTSPNLSFATSSYSLEIGSDEYNNFTAQVLTNAHNVGVTYSSSNPNVASVDASTGNITLGTTEGTATISAISVADEAYEAGTASYTITLTPAVAYEWRRSELKDIGPNDEFLIVDLFSQLALPTMQSSRYSPAGIPVRLNKDLTAASLNSYTTEDSVTWNVVSSTDGYSFNSNSQKKKYLLFCKDESEGIEIGTTTDGKTHIFTEETYILKTDSTTECKTLVDKGWSRCLAISNQHKDWRCYAKSIIESYKVYVAYFKKTTKQPSYTTQVTKPTINIDENNCVSITADSGCTIYYTTDNTDVTTDGSLSANAILYSGNNLALSKATTIKAIAMDADGNISEISTESFKWHDTVTLPYYENFDQELGNFTIENTASDTETSCPEWRTAKYSSGDQEYNCATATGKYANSDVYNVGTSRLLSPFISLKGYETVKLYFVHSGNNFTENKTAERCQLFYRTTSSGTWTQVDIPTMFNCSSDHNACNSGNITLLGANQKIEIFDADSLVQLSFLFTNAETSGDNYGTWNIHKLVVAGSRHGETDGYETVTLKSDGFATYVTQNDIDWSKTRNNTTNDNHVRGFKVIEFDNNTVVLQELGTGTGDAETVTPAETPIVIKGTQGQNPLVIAETDGCIAKAANNLLHPSYGNVTASASQSLYVIQKGADGIKAWYKLGKQTIPYRKAYLNGADEVEQVTHSNSNPAKGIYVSMEDITTGIDVIRDDVHTGELYNLNGMRVSHPTKGLYILNGRKVIIK